MASGRRRANKASRGADALLGYVIPLFFVAVAAYQEIHDKQIDKYVIGALLIFGLGALGWRIDVLFEQYIEAKAASQAALKDVTGNDSDDDEDKLTTQDH